MMAGKKRSQSPADSTMCGVHKEWDESLCPICMEHPHNAVLLLCSSHGKGCRPYVCDTSYRHSNCLDRYRKLKMDSGNIPSSSNPTNLQHQGSGAYSSSISPIPYGSSLAEFLENHHRRNGISMDPSENSSQHVVGRMDPEAHETGNIQPKNLKLKCPLCRGEVESWKVVQDARTYLNLKTRSCTRESCSFVGNYRELRRHARSVHPSARPAEIDPSRQRAWRQFEHQREYEDIVNAIRSAIPGAVVWGDYVIENEGGNGNGERSTPDERGRGPGEFNGSLWTTFFLFQMLGSMDPAGEPRSRSRGSWSRHRRLTGSWSRRRYLWGENLLGMHHDIDDDVDDEYEEEELNVVDPGDENNSHVPRRRRRLTQQRSNEDQPS